ncbi:M20/M25/M40 family metallo-hydrolase, partial [bacterium]|nr:M20/M25/M40 family metallo-hydrolase [bacterium]
MNLNSSCLKRTFVVVLFTSYLVLSGCQNLQSLSSSNDNSLKHPKEFPAVPYELISTDSIFTYLEALTSIQPYSGWRNSASSGEAEALDYVQNQLDGFSNLKTNGMELERQEFKVYAGVELWTTEIHLTVAGQEIEVPADGLRGSRYDPKIALSLDSDGKANDTERNPLEASGSILVVNQDDQLDKLSSSDVENMIMILDYAVIDSVTNQDFVSNSRSLIRLIDNGLKGLILVTSYSNVDGESRGSMIGDGGVFQWFDHKQRIPILYVRLEDLTTAGVENWGDFEKVESARMVWDSDVMMPGTSGNLIMHIPGVDSSKAVLLSAHIDSPNGPGAFDDGSGSAILLEIARILNESKVQPAVDLYLAWFGGHELGTYGSSYFISTHQELIDKLLAMLVIDPVGMPMDGKQINISTSYSSYKGFGDDRSLWADFLSSDLTTHGIPFEQEIFDGLIADNSNFDAFNVPEFNLSVLDNAEWMAKGSAYGHYASHWHDPYESVELARTVDEVFVDITKIALSAALETGREEVTLKVTPKTEHRAVVIASHTENPSIAPALMQ